MLRKYREAGKIAKEALELAVDMVREDVLYEEIADKVEKYIIDSGAKPAFPVNISVNSVAAHYTPYRGDKKKIKKGDVVKIDVGAHIDGYIADTAITVEVGTNRYEDMIDSVEKLLKKILREIYPFMPVREAGRIAEGTAKQYGYKVIKNLTGHKMDRYTLHSGVSVPNYDNGDATPFEPYCAYAIEPFLTDGVGYVVEDGNSNIYLLKSSEPKELYREFLTLPFAQRWVVDRFGDDSILRNRNIHNYGILKERGKGIVVQREHTVVVLDDYIEITTR